MILIAGVSKSGKTTICQEVVRCFASLRHVKASAVLRSLGRPITDLSNADVLANQTALIRALEYERRKDRIDLLDGHAVVESRRVATKLPQEVFDGLRLSGIAVVIEEPSVISRRRFGTTFETSVEWIASVQQMELDCCATEAWRLSLPFITLERDRVPKLWQFWMEVNARSATSR